jgi:small subunit ribosomal protein S1
MSDISTPITGSEDTDMENAMSASDGDAETSQSAEAESSRGAAAKITMTFDASEIINAELLEEEGYTDAQMLEMIQLYEGSLSEIKEGQIVEGRVVNVLENEVLVDVGFKSEGTIALSEFREVDGVHVGDVYDVYLESFENQDGLISLSKEKADFLKVWDDIKFAFDVNRVVHGVVDRRIKGGLVVDLMGVDAFLPGSQVALRQVPDLDALLGETFEFRIIKINKRRRNIVVSRRVVLEEERDKKKKKLIAELEKGQIRKGAVKNITEFGAFVDLGGIDGLLHITDLSWGRVSHPSEVVNIGQDLEVKVLEFDRDRERISLGLKQLQAYPWADVEAKYPEGQLVDGKVVSITNYGAFVELEKGIEGLIHISEMSWTRNVRHPSKIVSIGESVEAMVLKVDPENEKISLGFKQAEPDPWQTLSERYPSGTAIEGKVRNLTDFGAFVEVEDGIDGLVHISDMSWTKRVRHPKEIVKKGDSVTVVILDINSEKRRISLGIKQLIENPWDELAERYDIGVEADGKVVRMLEHGAIVEVEDQVEGFVPLQHLGIADIDKPHEHFQVDETIKLRVIKIQPENRKIVFSVGEYYEAHPDELDAFLEAHPKRELTEEELAQVASEVDEELDRELAEEDAEA